jgi:O-antigen/teichoic acid export membrane protein
MNVALGPDPLEGRLLVPQMPDDTGAGPDEHVLIRRYRGGSHTRPAGPDPWRPGRDGLLTGVGYSGLAQAAPLVVNVVLTPFLLQHLGLDRFGVWSLILVLLATFTSLDGGVGASLARYYAFHCARGDRAGAGRLVVGSLVLFVGLGVLVTTGCMLVTPLALDLLNVPAALRGETAELLRVVGPLVTLALVTNSATALLQANSRFRGLATVSAASCCGYAAGVLLFVTGADLPVLAEVLAARYVILLAGGFSLGMRHITIGRPLLPDTTVLREFRGYALRVQLSGLTTFLNGEIDALVIGALLPIRYVAIFAVGYQAASALRSLPLFAFPPILTRMTSAYAARGLAGSVAEFEAVQPRWLPAVLTYGVVATSAVGFAVQLWVGPELALAGLVAAMLMAGYTVHVALTGIRTCFVRASGRPGLETRYSWFATALNLVLTVPFAVLFGLVGVVAATVVGLLASSLYFVVLCRRVAGLRDRRLTWRWAGATALGAITAVLGELLVLRLEWHGVVPLLLAGVPVLTGLLVTVAAAARDVRTIVWRESG